MYLNNMCISSHSLSLSLSLSLSHTHTHTHTHKRYSPRSGCKFLLRAVLICRENSAWGRQSNEITDAGAKCLTGVLAQCAALAHLDLQDYDIGTVG